MHLEHSKLRGSISLSPGKARDWWIGQVWYPAVSSHVRVLGEQRIWGYTICGCNQWSGVVLIRKAGVVSGIKTYEASGVRNDDWKLPCFLVGEPRTLEDFRVRPVKHQGIC